MYRKSKKLVVWSLVVCMILTQMLFTNLAFATAKTTALSSARLAGADRYQTAIEISKAEWTTSQYAVLAYGEGFADALAAAPLAGKYDAPILLTDKDALSAGVLAELQRLGVKNVFVVGGEGVVAKAVADAVAAAGIAVERLAGADRYATALAVANKIGTTTEVVVAYGENYPDALSISAIAAAKGMPILLTDKDAMSADVKAYIGTKKAYVVGGEGAVSAAVVNGLTGAVRLSGADRYATNLAVLKQFEGTLNWLNVFVATGEGFADALAGSALAARYGSPVVLAASSIATDTAAYLAGKVNSQTGVIAFGGAAVVSDVVVNSVKPAAPTTLGVESISSVGLQAVKVAFNQEVDDVTAKTIGNYKMDGNPINGVVYLAGDNKSVTIIMNSAKPQYGKALFTVQGQKILSKDTLTSIPKVEKELQFSDVEVPKVDSVAVTGNKTVKVYFNEPVAMDAAFLSNVGTYFKIDGQNLTTYGFSSPGVAAVTTGTADAMMGVKLELSFAVALPAGNHTLKVSKGVTGDYLFDSANFVVAETETSFSVASVSDAPQVVTVTGEDNGIVYVTYNRAMDSATALSTANYALNTYVLNGTTATAASFVSGSGDTKVKLRFDQSDIEASSNLLIIKKDVKDAYGNKLDPNDDKRVNFTSTSDTVKPTVVSAVVLDKTTIRVKFSETVDGDTADQTSNYELKDSSGSSISVSGVVNKDGTSADSDTWVLTTTNAAGKLLTGSGYTLKIKSIMDISKAMNVMDTYTVTLNGSDDVKPTAVQAVKYDGKKVVVFFSESMDGATIADKANYAYLDDQTTSATHSLPTGTEISTGNDNKYVMITFPSGFSVTETATRLKSENQNIVTGVRVANVKDSAGNLLDSIAQLLQIDASSSASDQPTYNEDTFNLYAEGSSDVKAELEFNRPLASLDPKDFYIYDGVTSSTAVQAETGYISGNKIVLKFSAGAAAVKGFGKDATIYTTTTAAIDSVDAAGVKVANITTGTVKVNDDQIAPKLISDRIYATTGTTGTATVSLTFTEKIDLSIAGGYILDFNIYVNGHKSTINTANVGTSGTTLTFTIADAIPTTATTVLVKALPVVEGDQTKYVKIRDPKDANGDWNYYAPSSDDQDGYTVPGARMIP